MKTVINAKQLKEWLSAIPDELPVVLGCEAECCMEDLCSMRVEKGRIVLSMLKNTTKQQEYNT
jgi:hypothetical protein